MSQSVPDRLAAALGDRYRIERELGAGGMATVYLAEDLKHDRKVAIKVLKPELAAVLGAERFVQEIKTTAALSHPHILPLFDSGEAGGFLYYVMPYIQGETIREKLNRETQFGVEEAVKIAIDVAEALDYAHRHGVIHRDIKPENILLHDGRPMVMDFGIALAVSAAAGGRMTETGLSLGTPHYMSPEQATADKQITARSDVYSLASVLYEMLTGEPPHMGTSAQQIIMKIIAEPVKPATELRRAIPPHVSAALALALEKLPADRFVTAKEFGEALTGARAMVTYSAAATAQPAAVVSRRAPRVREWVAWSVAAIGMTAGAWSIVHSTRIARPGLVEFTVEMPDSITVTTGRNNAVVALSPDGSMMAFQGLLPPAQRQEGRLQALYLRSFDDRTAQLIRGTEGGFRPTFSPDGSEILFQTEAALRRISVRGGTSRVLVDSGGPASWGDNHDVVYSDGRNLWIVSEEGGAARVLARPDSLRRHRGYNWPHVLPGSQSALITISVEQDGPDSMRLGVVSLPRGRVTELTPVIHGINPRYSPTGHVMYATPDGKLLAVPFSTGALEATGAPVRVADGIAVGPIGAAAFDVAGGGTVAWLQTGQGLDLRREIVNVTRAGTPTLLSTSAGYYQSPRVSPDGRYVALTVFGGSGPPDQMGPDPDIWRLDLRSGVLSRVTTDSASAGPAWSPDGSRIAFLTPGDTAVRWQPTFTTAPPMVLARGSRPLLTIAFGKTHGHVVVESWADRGRPQTADILVAPVDSQADLRPLLAESYPERAPILSPDERFIAYTTTRTGTQEVYVRPFPTGGSEVQLSSGGGSQPVWSRDGSELYFRTPTNYLVSAQLDAVARLRVVALDTLFRATLDNVSTSHSAANYDVYPDGRSFVMLRSALNTAVLRAGSAPLVVVKNWSAGARER